MATTVSFASHHIGEGHRPHNRPRLGSFGRNGLNFGPRFNEGNIQVTRTDPCPMPLLNPREFDVYYRIYNPASLSNTESPPLLVVHGGPSLPSDYLYPLVQHFPSSRSIIFYDQLGCGRSSRPEDKKMYSIEHAVNDLKELVEALQLTKFHLLGHSFGGIVAYEYSAQHHSGKCLSLTLDSTPSDMQMSLDEVSRLEDEVRSLLILEEDEEGNEKPQDISKLVQDRLRRRNECRIDVMPDSLATAIESRGTTFVPESVADYVAHAPSSHALPPTLVIRGQYDFVTEKCIQGWRAIFTQESESKENSSSSHQRTSSYREEELSNCAHYCHLEDAKSFSELVKGHCFVHDY